MSVQANQTNATPGDTFSPTTIQAGVYPITTVTSTITIPITGLLSSSVVTCSYVHPTAGGAAQWFTAITEGTGQVVIGLGQNSASGEQIQWISKQ